MNSWRQEFLVFAIFLTITGAHESQLKGPENTLSVVGSNVTLKCSSASRGCNNAEWHKYGGSPSTVFNDRGILSAYRDRYRVDNSSGCDLVIKDVELTDAGRFICRALSPTNTVERIAYLIILKNHLKCAINKDLDNTANGDGVPLTCEVTYNGTDYASMVWKAVEDALVAEDVGKTIRRSLLVVASAPEVPSFICNTSFVVETKHSDGTPIIGLATNTMVTTCETSVIKVMYSVKYVQLSPSLSSYPPGSSITCSAKGHPSPTFKWQILENDVTWMDIPNLTGNEFTLNDASSGWYRCVAMNIVRSITYTETSHAFQVNDRGLNDKLSSTNASDDRHGFGTVIGFLVSILLTAVAFATLFRLKYLKFRQRPYNKRADNVEQHMDDEMRSSSDQPSDMNHSIPNTTQAPLVRDTVAEELERSACNLEGTESMHDLRRLTSSDGYCEVTGVGEQESAYARLREDINANEYATLEQRQKSEPKKESKP